MARAASPINAQAESCQGAIMSQGTSVIELDPDDSNMGYDMPIAYPVHCTTSACAWAGTIADCGKNWDIKEWTKPGFVVLMCPKCGEPSVVF